MFTSTEVARERGDVFTLPRPSSLTCVFCGRCWLDGSFIITSCFIAVKDSIDVWNLKCGTTLVFGKGVWSCLMFGKSGLWSCLMFEESGQWNYLMFEKSGQWNNLMLEKKECGRIRCLKKSGGGII